MTTFTKPNLRLSYRFLIISWLLISIIPVKSIATTPDNIKKLSVEDAASTPFITTWQTDDTEITIPTHSGETYMYDISWSNLTNPGVGDGGASGITGDFTITSLTSGDIYRIEILGTFPRIYFNNSGDKEKILSIEQWGDNDWQSMENAFYGCSNLQVNAPDAPNFSFCQDLTNMFRGCASLNADLSSWNTEVSNVELFNGMFREATSFNGDITGWGVTSAKEMSEMFFFASSFNQPIGNWRTENVNTMALMFAGATSFNQPINTTPAAVPLYWVTSSVTNMDQMFSGAAAFNQPIGNWNVSNVNIIRSMFQNASSFNQNINSWDISGVSDLSALFNNATSYNQPLDSWANKLTLVTRMNNMFNGATAFNQVISTWDVSNVQEMNGLFANTTYNQDITSWVVGNVTRFNGMFESNTAFNQDISTWDINIISTNIDMRQMFQGATSFNQDLGGWDIRGLRFAVNMFNNSGLTIAHYDSLLIGWSVQPFLPSNVSFGASGLYYCAGESGRAALLANSWFITDAGLGCISVFEGSTTAGYEIFNNQLVAVDIGSGTAGTGKTKDITIENNLASIITFNSPIITGTGFSITAPAVLPTTIPAGGNLTITVQVLASAGTYTEDISFTSPDFSSSFDFPITGKITNTVEPEIKVFQGSLPFGTEIPDGDITGYDIGNELRGNNVTNQITILNNGSADLNISSLGVSGTGFSLFPNTGFTIPVDDSQVIDITLNGNISGFFSETISMVNDDLDEDPFDFVITGEIFGPDIAVFDGLNIYSDPEIFDAQVTPIHFGSGLTGSNVVHQLTIANLGPVDLAISDISITGSSFSITSAIPSLINAEFDGIVSYETIDITLDGSDGGVFNETITITTDDDDELSFTFNISGEIIDPAAPKVYWSEKNGNEINRSNLDGSAFQQYFADPSYQPRGLALDTLNNIVYWTNNWGQIRKGDIDDTGLINVTDFMNDGIDISREMGGVALDVTGDKIYWVSTFDGTIKSADLSTTDPFSVNTTSIISGLENPTSVAVDPAGGKLYYTTNFNNAGADDNIATLHQVNLDGSNDIVLATEQIVGEQYTFRDVKLDIDNNLIYWSSGGEDDFNPIGKIFSANIGDVSGTISSFSTLNDNPLGIDLDLANGKIYWIDKFIYMEPHRMGRSNMDGSNTEQIHEANLGQPLFLALDVPPIALSCVTPPTAIAGVDQSICESDLVVLNGSMGGSATTITWFTSGDGSFDNINLLTATYTPGTTDISNGNVTLTITTDDPDGAGSCIAASDDLLVTITTSPTTIAGVDQSICESDLVVLNGSMGGSATAITWSTSGDGSFDNINLLTATYTPGTADLSNGNVTLTITTDDPDGAGSCIAASDDLLVTITTSPTTIAGVDQSICESDLVVLNGSMGGSATAITWSTSGDGSFDDDTSLTASYTPGSTDINNGNVTLSITTDDPDGTGNCVAATDDLDISIESLHTADAGIDQTVCPSDGVLLDGTIGGSASSSIWTTTGDGSFDDENLLNATYSPGTTDISNGNVTLSLGTVATICPSAVDQLVVTINQSITAMDQSGSLNVNETISIDLLNGSTINTGDIITLNLITQPQKGTATLNSDGTLDYTATAGHVGDDSFEFQLTNQCDQSATATITITIENDSPIFDNGNANAVPGSPVTINITDLITDLNGNIDLSSIRIVQQPGSGAVASLDENNNLIVDYTGIVFFGTDEVVLEVCDFDGACSEAVILIEVSPLPINAFNAVSPNGDGKHDFLEFEYIEAYPNNEVTIFNRWGDTVFSIAEYNNQGNVFVGSSNKGGSKELPAGTYYYTVLLKDTDEIINGFFELRR